MCKELYDPESRDESQQSRAAIIDRATGRTEKIEIQSASIDLLERLENHDKGAVLFS